jgi:hypothetical protein
MIFGWPWKKGKLFECSFDGLRRCPLLTGMDWRLPRVNRTTGDRAAVEKSNFPCYSMRNDFRMALEKGEAI